MVGLCLNTQDHAGKAMDLLTEKSQYPWLYLAAKEAEKYKRKRG